MHLRRVGYLPNEQSFQSGLPEGKSILSLNKGRTARERESGKQQKRFQRIRARSHEDRTGQGKAK